MAGNAKTLLALVLACSLGGDARAEEDVAIAAGCFEIGCQQGIGCKHAPTRTVCLDAYRIDRTEVTNAAYRECVSSGACDVPVKPGKDYSDDGASNRPVRGVTWDQASAYCTWVGKRLPTEAEWERAARGPGEGLHPWGDDRPTCEHVRFGACGRGEPDTEPVCSHAKGHSPEGLCDMTGNVAEWVADWWAPISKRARKLETRNPRGPCGGKATCKGRTLRVVKGVPHPTPSVMQVATRGPGRPRAHSLRGFRCAASDSRLPSP